MLAKFFNLTFILFVLSYFICLSQSRSSVENSFTPKELQDDFLIFRKALETTYPSLYRYTDSLTVSKILDDQVLKLNKSMREVEFYQLIGLTVARLNDEHLIPTPSKDYYKSLETANHFFPFSLKIIDRRCYIYKSANNENSIPIGAEILSINGRSVVEILNILLPTIPSDGYIETFNIRHLEDYCITQNENIFDLNYPIYIEKVDSFRIEFIHPKNKLEKKVLIVSGLNFKNYKDFYNKRREYKAPLDFKYHSKNIAYLRISSFHKFHRDDFKQDFPYLFDSIFTQLRKNRIKNLILDLRNNEGGDMTGQKLLSYIVPQSYTLFDYVEEKFTGYPAVKDYLENGEDLFFVDSIVYRTAGGMYRLKKEFLHYLPFLTEQIPDKNSYSGNLFVLINGASGSMASVVASCLKANTKAVFIGEESGGAMEGNTSQGFALLTLPNTRIRVEIPVTKTVHKVGYIKGRGVIPDYNVTPKIDDIIKGVDTELNFALDLIKLKK